MNTSNRPPFTQIFALGALLAASTASAQWVTEDYPLVAGWNAIWLSHDASHDTIGNLVPGTVEEIWRWNPLASTSQFTQSPDTPNIQPDTQWLVWKNGFPVDSTMTTLAPNAAYLVKVADGTANFTLQLTGKPVPPRYSWKSSGLNFFGFPSKVPETNFETFFSYSSALSAGPDIFKYTGGPITSNPVEVLSPLFEDVARGKAYWIRSTQFTDYYGPLSVTISNSGLAFGDIGTALALKIKNVTSETVTATLTPVTSAAAPAGQTPIAGAVPLRLRGSLNPTTGQFDYTAFTAASPIVLAAGQEKEIIFATDRATMGGTPGDVFQSVLRITDSLGISQIDLPVIAETTSRAGLWVGTAVVTAVNQVTAAPGPLLASGEGTITVTTDADADAPSAFPMRLIVHRADGGTVKMLQQVYLGENTGSTVILTPDQSQLDPSRLAGARRISTSTLPLKENLTGSGADLGLTGTATFSSTVDYADATNPFVHTYHPDHDNKDAQFSGTPLAEGTESYTFTRALSLNFLADPSTLGLSDLGWGSTVLGGTYEETLTGLRAQAITVKGSFILRRVSDIGTLTE